jgi:predicted DNA-binding transcriptional regulator AlpA
MMGAMGKTAAATDLIGAAEITQMLGLSRQRIGQLLAAESFPEPFKELIMGKIYLYPEVKAWALEHGYQIYAITRTQKQARTRIPDDVPRPQARPRKQAPEAELVDPETDT